MTEYRHVELIGGPLDGDSVDVPIDDDDETGVALPADGCAYPGGHSIYDLHPDDPDPHRLHWVRDTA